MKRTVSILLASALLLSLASCGPKGESSDPKGSQSSSQGQAEPVLPTPNFPSFPSSLRTALTLTGTPTTTPTMSITAR